MFAAPTAVPKRALLAEMVIKPKIAKRVAENEANLVCSVAVLSRLHPMSTAPICRPRTYSALPALIQALTKKITARIEQTMASRASTDGGGLHIVSSDGAAPRDPAERYPCCPEMTVYIRIYLVRTCALTCCV